MRFFNFGESLNQKTLREKNERIYSKLLTPYGIHCLTILHNVSPAILYEEALLYETDSAVSDTGVLIVSSSEKTGRSPKDKRIVTTPEFIDDILWGDVNIGIDEDTF